ncbi:excinuclease ABC subunit UvrA [Solibacillus daqui]|uniref:excinuclease ABC subunit UvrA n=1 Tax=Solibacillus daqui TaxID=2912187 RepID=UPI002366C9DF|nr:excinuclease ABC subunit UvrA [Solibacillus daqui]
MNQIIIENAYEGNLKNISVTIPRNQLVCVTGVSGSGKSTLVLDTLYQECQRQYMEAIGYQGIQKPDVEAVRNISPAIQINQHLTNKNPRSTVGTLTNIYTDLRMVYEKISERPCSDCGKVFAQHEGKEATEIAHGEYKTFVQCPHCDSKQLKLTRAHFSYNKSDGACPTCSGLGVEVAIDWDKVLDETKPLEDGAVHFLDKGYRDYVINILKNGFAFYGLADVQNVPLNQWSEQHRALLIKGAEAANIDAEKGVPKNVTKGRFEGIEPLLWRRFADKNGDSEVEQYFKKSTCSACDGERLREESRQAIVNNKRLPELSNYSLEHLAAWIDALNAKLTDSERAYVGHFILDMTTKLARLLKVGVGYLTLDRQTITLSGGEQQKIKLSATLDSELTGVIYLLDEPTSGLHPKDTLGMIDILKRMRDLGNTVIVIEHDTDVMKAADVILDIGPGAGIFGGELIGQGTLAQLLDTETSVTGNYLKKPVELNTKPRQANGYITLAKVSENNLQNVTVQFPKQCFTTVVGASGSGKSTLIFDVLANETFDDFDQVITVQQASISRMRRSNIATYTDAFTVLRNLYAKEPSAKEKGFTNKHFSFNTAGGRCDHCEGLGVVPSNMMFFDNVELVCPVCNGKRFKDEILDVTLHGYSISEMLDMSITEAAEVLQADKKLTKIFSLLIEVGLGYITLGQSLTTLSGGEGQRLKLAKELLSVKGQQNLFLIDEPSTGLHPVDIENFIILLNKMVEEGHTVIVVEHNEQIIRESDYLIELGPEGGDKGGTVIATGTPEEIKGNKQSIMREFL